MNDKESWRSEVQEFMRLLDKTELRDPQMEIGHALRQWAFNKELRSFYREVFKAIEPSRMWRNCYRDIIAEVANIDAGNSIDGRSWSKKHQEAADVIYNSFRRAEIAARNLPQKGREIGIDFEELVAKADAMTKWAPWGRRSGHAKRRAANAAFRLLLLYRGRPAEAGKGSRFCRLAELLARDERGIDHYCRDILSRANSPQR
jgi:hypothetical protein